MITKSFSKFHGSRLAAALAAVACIGLASTASATMITGSISSPPANSSTNPIDISAGTAAWAYYGYGATTTGTFSPGNTANFSQLASIGQYSPGHSASGGSVWLTFPSAPSGPSTEFVYTWGTGAAGNSYTYSLTTTLLAPSETLNLYLLSFDSASNLSATLSSGSGSYTNGGAVFPATPGSTGNGSGQGHGYAVLSLAITGASTGDVLTFTDTTNIAGVTGVSSPNGNVGIQAADVVVVPEPFTLGLLGVGGLGLLLLKRRRMV
jgi:hypothetical protein